MNGAFVSTHAGDSQLSQFCCCGHNSFDPLSTKARESIKKDRVSTTNTNMMNQAVSCRATRNTTVLHNQDARRSMQAIINNMLSTTNDRDLLPLGILSARTTAPSSCQCSHGPSFQLDEGQICTVCNVQASTYSWSTSHDNVTPLSTSRRVPRQARERREGGNTSSNNETLGELLRIIGDVLDIIGDDDGQPEK